MAKKKHRSSGGFKIPVAPVVGLAAGIVTSQNGEPSPWENILKGDEGSLRWAFNQLCERYTGYYPPEGNWKPWRMNAGITPLVVGMLVHKFIGGTLGVNRMLGRAKVPVFRL